MSYYPNFIVEIDNDEYQVTHSKIVNNDDVQIAFKVMIADKEFPLETTYNYALAKELKETHNLVIEHELYNALTTEIGVEVYQQVKGELPIEYTNCDPQEILDFWQDKKENDPDYAHWKIKEAK